jgi:hypothetical protein
MVLEIALSFLGGVLFAALISDSFLFSFVRLLCGRGAKVSGSGDVYGLQVGVQAFAHERALVSS